VAGYRFELLGMVGTVRIAVEHVTRKGSFA
jgi:hypothetical protein